MPLIFRVLFALASSVCTTLCIDGIIDGRDWAAFAGGMAVYFAIAALIPGDNR